MPEMAKNFKTLQCTKILKHFSVLIIRRRSLSSLCLCTRWKEEGNDTFFSFTRLWDLNDSRLYKIEEGTTHLVSCPNRLSYCPAPASQIDYHIVQPALLADSSPQQGGGRLFGASARFFFTKTAAWRAVSWPRLSKVALFVFWPDINLLWSASIFFIIMTGHLKDNLFVLTALQGGLREAVQVLFVPKILLCVTYITHFSGLRRLSNVLQRT